MQCRSVPDPRMGPRQPGPASTAVPPPGPAWDSRGRPECSSRSQLRWLVCLLGQTWSQGAPRSGRARRRAGECLQAPRPPRPTWPCPACACVPREPPSSRGPWRQGRMALTWSNALQRFHEATNPVAVLTVQCPGVLGGSQQHSGPCERCRGRTGGRRCGRPPSAPACLALLRAHAQPRPPGPLPHGQAPCRAEGGE